MIRFISIFLLFGISSSISAQNEFIDSLRAMLKTHTHEDPVRVNLLYTLGSGMTHYDQIAGIAAVKEGLDLSKKLKWKKGEIIGLIHWVDFKNRQGEFNEAITAGLTALKLLETYADRELQYLANINLAEVYRLMSNFENAEMHYKTCIELAEQLRKNEYSTSVNLSMATCYMGMGDWVKFDHYLEKGLEMAIKQNDIGSQARAFELRASRESNQKKYVEAKTDYLRNLSLLNRSDNYRNSSFVQSQLGTIYAQLNMKDSALYYSNAALSEAKTFKLNKELGDAYGSLFNVYYIFKDYKNALKNYLIYDSLQNKDFNMQSAKDVERTRAKFNEEARANAAKKELARQKVIQTGTITGLIAVLFFTGLLLFQRNKIKKANAALQIAKDRAEHSEKYKQQFLANMSHEIRTPMNAVMGLNNLLLGKHPRKDQLKYLKGIQQSSDTLLHIINDILDLAKVEAGKIDLETIDFSLPALAQQLKLTMKHRAEEKGLNFSIHIDQRIPDVVIGDPTRISQILINLTNNAIKFTDKGSVSVSIEHLNNENESSNLINFRVIDTGIGIPKDKLTRVFESFTQVNTSDTRKYGGTGLGLSISRQLVELMGGTLNVESVENAGTIFSFAILLPAGSEDRLNASQSASDIDAEVLNGLRILVVDDNEYNRIVAQDTLMSKADVEITLATNGKEAVDLFLANDFDIILMDVQMPVMNGYEATKSIRNSKETNRNPMIPIIALTASVVRGDLDKCRAAGMNDYVPKPFHPHQLVEAIAKATGRQLKFRRRISTSNEQRQQTIHTTDLSYLEQFCEGDKVRMKKYIDIFLSTSPPFIYLLEKLLAERSFDEIASQVHGFKTKWIMMGMNETKDLAQEIEKMCMESLDNESTLARVKQLITQIYDAQDELYSF